MYVGPNTCLAEHGIGCESVNIGSMSLGRVVRHGFGEQLLMCVEGHIAHDLNVFVNVLVRERALSTE